VLRRRIRVGLAALGAKHVEPGIAQLLLLGASLGHGSRFTGVEDRGFLGRALAVVAGIAGLPDLIAGKAGRGREVGHPHRLVEAFLVTPAAVRKIEDFLLPVTLNE